MSNPVTIKFRDGTERKFEDRGRAGGSYQQHVEYVGNVVRVIDVWGQSKAFPLDVVQEVIECPTSY